MVIRLADWKRLSCAHCSVRPSSDRHNGHQLAQNFTSVGLPPCRRSAAGRLSAPCSLPICAATVSACALLKDGNPSVSKSPPQTAPNNTPPIRGKIFFDFILMMLLVEWMFIRMTFGLYAYYCYCATVGKQAIKYGYQGAGCFFIAPISILLFFIYCPCISASQKQPALQTKI